MKKLGLFAVLGFALAGCGGVKRSTGPSSSVLRVFPVSRNLRLGAGVARFLSPTRVAITTFGSSSCPAVPDHLTVVGRNVIRIHLVTGTRTATGFVAHPPAGGICTADYGATTMAVAIDPSQIDVHQELRILLFYQDDPHPTILTAPPL